MEDEWPEDAWFDLGTLWSVDVWDDDGSPRIILRATDLGLGTCWIGGIFNRSRFADKAGVREDEVLPAISPLGYPTQKRSVTDSIIRWSAGSRNGSPWQQLFFHGSFEMALPEGAAGRYLAPLEMLRLGPSASNRQPWRVVKDQGRDTPALTVHIFSCGLPNLLDAQVVSISKGHIYSLLDYSMDHHWMVRHVHSHFPSSVCFVFCRRFRPRQLPNSGTRVPPAGLDLRPLS